MKKQHYISFFLFTLMICSFSLLNAQTKGSKDYVDTFVVVKNYDPTISNAQKINERPSINDTLNLMPKLSYSFLKTNIPIPFTPDTIPPAHIKAEPIVRLYRGYVKAGIGNNMNNLVDAYYNSLRSSDHNFGIRLHHLSSNGVHNVDYSGWSDNSLSAFAKKFYREGMIYGKVKFNRNVVHNYGFNDSLLDEIKVNNKDFLKQRYMSLGGKVGYKSSYTDSNTTRIQSYLQYRFYGDRFNDNEQYALGHVLLSRYNLNDLYKLPIDIDYNHLSNMTDSTGSAIVKLEPTISTIGKKWKLNVGLNIHVEVADKATFHFYPHALFKYNVISNILIPYIGLSGGIKRVNFYSLSQENPFVNPVLNIKNENTKYDLMIGMRGTLSRYLAFNVSASQSNIENMPLYVLNREDVLQNNFDVIYDKILVRHVMLQLDYNKVKHLNINLRGEYFNYDPTNELKAWHKPTLKLSLFGTYNLVDKILIHAGIYAANATYERNFKGEITTTGIIKLPIAEKINGWIDGNLGIEYRYTNRLSILLNFNNIGAVKYYRWTNYPTQQFNVLGGLTYAF